MNGGNGGKERCGPGWRREVKVPNWFLWLGRESCGQQHEKGGMR
jgi:hypothetical protein